MKRFHFRIWTGPTCVQEYATRLRAVAMPWQVVTIEGTEHLHYSIVAVDLACAQHEINPWFGKAGFPSVIPAINSEPYRVENI